MGTGATLFLFIDFGPFCKMIGILRTFVNSHGGVGALGKSQSQVERLNT